MDNLAQLSDISKKSLTSNIEIKTTFIGAENFPSVVNKLNKAEPCCCSDCPEVSAELAVVHSGPAHTASLSCIVASDPPANVRWAEYPSPPPCISKLYCNIINPRWYRRSLLLESDNNFLIESRGTLHTFIIRTVDSQHFGTYKCLASNSLGRDLAEIQLTGEASHFLLTFLQFHFTVVRVTQSSSFPERNPERYEWQSQTYLADWILLQHPGIQAELQENYGTKIYVDILFTCQLSMFFCNV